MLENDRKHDRKIEVRGTTLPTGMIGKPNKKNRAPRGSGNQGWIVSVWSILESRACMTMVDRKRQSPEWRKTTTSCTPVKNTTRTGTLSWKDTAVPCV